MPVELLDLGRVRGVGPVLLHNFFHLEIPAQLRCLVYMRV